MGDSSTGTVVSSVCSTPISLILIHLHKNIYIRTLGNNTPTVNTAFLGRAYDTKRALIELPIVLTHSRACNKKLVEVIKIS